VDCIYNPWNYNNRSRVVLEPIRLNHYLTRSYTECLAKARDPRLANMTFSWRKDLGSKLCDTYMKGQELYKDSEHIRDEHLSASLWPRIIKATMKHFGQWRDGGLLFDFGVSSPLSFCFAFFRPQLRGSSRSYYSKGQCTEDC
jgi:hypothetical protein